MSKRKVKGVQGLIRRKTEADLRTEFNERFVAEYLVDLNATQAYRRAGGEAKRADQAGYQLLRNAEISAAVQKGRLAQLKRAEKKGDFNAVTMLREIQRIALINVRDFFDERGNLIPVNQWTREMGAQVASVEVVERNLISNDGRMDTVHKIKFWNKTHALEMARDYLGLIHSLADDERPRVPVFILPVGARVATQ